MKKILLSLALLLPTVGFGQEENGVGVVTTPPKKNSGVKTGKLPVEDPRSPFTKSPAEKGPGPAIPPLQRLESIKLQKLSSAQGSQLQDLITQAQQLKDTEKAIQTLQGIKKALNINFITNLLNRLDRLVKAKKMTTIAQNLTQLHSDLETLVFNIQMDPKIASEVKAGLLKLSPAIFTIIVRYAQDLVAKAQKLQGTAQQNLYKQALALIYQLLERQELLNTIPGLKDLKATLEKTLSGTKGLEEVKQVYTTGKEGGYLTGRRGKGNSGK